MKNTARISFQSVFLEESILLFLTYELTPSSTIASSTNTFCGQKTWLRRFFNDKTSTTTLTRFIILTDIAFSFV